MSGTATITTTTTVTPVTVTEVKNGTVQQVGSTIIVRTPEGFKSFTQGEVDKRGVKIMKGGKPVQLADLHAGDQLAATIITSKPPQIMTKRQVDASIASGSPEKGAAATSGAAATPPASGRATGTGAAAPAAPAAPAPKKLPKTASELPLDGLIGFVSLAIGVTLTSLRRRRMS